jgi:hypothetical protein
MRGFKCRSGWRLQLSLSLLDKNLQAIQLRQKTADSPSQADLASEYLGQALAPVGEQDGVDGEGAETSRVLDSYVERRGDRGETTGEIGGVWVLENRR